MLWVSLMLSPTFLVGCGIEIAGIGKARQDEIILMMLLASWLPIVVELMAGSIKKLSGIA